jgi:hypothetical protein
MQNEVGIIVSKFLEIECLGVKYFKSICKEPERENIKEILNLTSYFLSFVIEEDNQMLMVEVIKEELKLVPYCFKKDKILGLDGCPMEFFIHSLTKLIIVVRF